MIKSLRLKKIIKTVKAYCYLGTVFDRNLCGKSAALEVSQKRRQAFGTVLSILFTASSRPLEFYQLQETRTKIYVGIYFFLVNREL